MPEFLEDVRGAIWGELATARTIDPYRRNLQRAHVERLGTLMEPEEDAAPDEASAMARAELATLLAPVRTAAGSTRVDTPTRAHLRDVQARIEALLEG